MLSRGAATAALTLLTLSGLSPSALASSPMDGSGQCSSRACIFRADDPAPEGASVPAAPAASARPAAKPAAKKATVTAPKPRQAWKPLTPAQMQRASAWDRHLETICSGAVATGATMPPECLPSPAAAAPAAGAGPAAPAPPQFTPGDATREALSMLTPAPPRIGSAPCTSAGCEGTVGVPVWLWTDPWQAETAEATAGPYTVTATATPIQVVWSLGDGQTITCTTPGTPYNQAQHGWSSSPDCGGMYSRTGTYAITASMTYRVEWTGADTGQDDIVVTSSTRPFRVGEYQVVITTNN